MLRYNRFVALHYIVFKVQLLENREQLTENRFSSLKLILFSLAYLLYQIPVYIFIKQLLSVLLLLFSVL